MAVKILQVSDIHGSMVAVEKIAAKADEGYDVVFVAGDVTNFGTIAQAEMILSKIAEHCPRVFFVAGNCDPEALLNWQPATEKITNLHLKSAMLGELGIVGLGGGGPKSVGTIIEFNEEQFSSMLSELKPPSGRFILLSHTPPHGAEADHVGGRHVGSMAIREYVEKTAPILVSCGHIHEARSISKLEKTTVINAGPARNNYCASIIIEGEEVKAELQQL
ncbi:MAG: metallophosphoesterase [Aigarchaeota archaeon]|nr:metallophosphoesterase [Candidatus Pelearchaeum maunauluense]